MMQSFKANFLRRNPEQHKSDMADSRHPSAGTDGVSEENNSHEKWRKAFVLADNVRFTRTPDSAILTKQGKAAFDGETHSVQADTAQPYYAQKTPERPASAPAAQVNQAPAQQVSFGRTMHPQSAGARPVIANPLIYSRAKSAASAPAILDDGDMPPVAGGLGNVPAQTPPLFISDFAFFECGPFALEMRREPSLPQREQTPQTVSTSKPQISITEMYRVLECHLSHANQSVRPEAEQRAQAPVARDALAVPKMQTAGEAPKMAPVKAVAPVSVSAPTAQPIKAAMPVEARRETKSEKVQVATDKPIEVSRSQPLAQKPVQQRKPNSAYQFPALNLLQAPPQQEGMAQLSQEMLERSAGLLESVLEDFGIRGEIIHVRPGPVVTLYEFEPAAGVKSSRVIGLSDDIARSMSAVSARVAVIPGRNVIGIELPNEVRETVYLREIAQSRAFRETNFKLTLALGKSIGGEPVTAELAKMPHLLVAGTTGSGKSVAINTMILSLLYRLTPQQCRLIMVDPKMLELSVYDGIPHLLTPVVTDPKKAVVALKWAVREMEERYRKMAKIGVRNIDGFNARANEAREKGEVITCTVQGGFDRQTGELLYREEEMDLTPLPYIVIVVDEMADLMMVAGKEIEGAIQRLAQMARAAGIHLIMATQRPSVDVITGTIKANFPTRISFSVTSKIDSRTILGEQGAETLLGQGDMLFMSGGGTITRVHGAFVSDAEVEAVVSHLKTQGVPDYLATVTDGEEDEGNDASVADIIASASAGGNEDGEELYLQAVKIVMRDKKCSTSYIQRRLNVGYNKAATLVERMEDEGLVGAANHVGKREILVTQHQ